MPRTGVRIQALTHLEGFSAWDIRKHRKWLPVNIHAQNRSPYTSPYTLGGIQCMGYQETQKMAARKYTCPEQESVYKPFISPNLIWMRVRSVVHLLQSDIFFSITVNEAVTKPAYSSLCFKTGVSEISMHRAAPFICCAMILLPSISLCRSFWKCIVSHTTSCVTWGGLCMLSHAGSTVE